MASIPTVSWDETSPAGSQTIKLGDDRIREFKTQVREVIGVDHDFPSSGQATDNGQHLRVTLQEQSDLGSGAVGTTILGNQTVSGKGELVYTDEDDNDIVLTKGGGQNYSAPSDLANMTGIMNKIYPIGIVVTFGVSTNPATLLGVGTWTAITGKVIVGISPSDSEFDTLDETGGEKTHTLTIDEMPSHTHTWTNRTTGSSTSGMDTNGLYSGFTANTGATGGGLAHNNLQPYIVKYVWQRTA